MLREMGAHALLVGEHLLRKPYPGEAVKKLFPNCLEMSAQIDLLQKIMP